MRLIRPLVGRAAALGLAMLVATGAAGAETETEDGPLVVYLGLPPVPESEAIVRRELARARPRVPDEASLVHLDQRVSIHELGVFGAVDQRRCDREPQDPAEYQSLRDELYRAFLMQEETESRVARVQAAQLCLASPVPPDELAWPAMLDAIVAFENGDDPGARARFADALSIHPELGWVDAFPGEARPLFDQAAELVGQRPRATLELAPPEGMRVWIDGRGVLDPTEPIALPTGRHLVQVGSSSDLHLRAVFITLQADRGALVVDPAALSPSAATDAVLLPSVAAVLAQLDSGGARAVGHVVVMRDGARIWSWTPTTATLTPVRLVDDDAERRRRRAGMGALTAVGVLGTAAAIAGGVGLGLTGRQLSRGERWITPGWEDDPTLRSWRGLSTLLVAGSAAAAVGFGGLGISVALERRRGGPTAWLGIGAMAGPGAGHGSGLLDGFRVTLEIRGGAWR